MDANQKTANATKAATILRNLEKRQITGHYVETHDAKEALKRTASSVFDLLQNTYEADSQELLLIESQDAFAHPQLQFQVEEL